MTLVMGLVMTSLLSPSKSGMVDYTEDLAAELSREFELVFYHDPDNVPTVADRWGEVRPASACPRDRPGIETVTCRP